MTVTLTERQRQGEFTHETDSPVRRRKANNIVELLWIEATRDGDNLLQKTVSCIPGLMHSLSESKATKQLMKYVNH